MNKTIIENLIKEIIESNDRNVNATNKDTIHDLLQVYFYRLTKEELFGLAELTFNNNGMKKDLFKVALTCYTLALLKSDVPNPELDQKIFKILGNQFGAKIKEANITDFNGHVNEPYSDELSKVERLITANAFIGEDVTQLVKLSDYYFSLAYGLGSRKCELNPKINALERKINLPKKITKADGNPVYLWKAISYLSLAANVTRNPNKKIEFQIEKLMRIMQAMAKFYRNKNENKKAEQLALIYDQLLLQKEWLIQQRNVLTDEQKKGVDNSIQHLKKMIKDLKNEDVNKILENAEQRENDIMRLIFQTASTGKSVPTISPDQGKEDTIPEDQVVLKQKMDQNLQTLEDGKEIDLSAPADIYVKHADAMRKIKENTALSEFYIAFEQILTQCTLGSFAANSGKLSIEPGVLAKIGNLLGVTGTAGSIVGGILSVIDEELQKQENKHVAEFAYNLKIAHEIFSYAALTLALTLENEINTLSVKEMNSSLIADKLSAPAGAVSLGATLALISLPTLASPVDTKTTNEERAKLLVDAVMMHEPSKMKQIAGKVSKFIALGNILATKAGNIQKADGTLVHYSDILKKKTIAVTVDSKITKEELVTDLASLKNENGMLQDKNINLENEVKNLKATVDSFGKKVVQLEEINQAIQNKLIAQEQKAIELQNKNETLEKTVTNSEAKIGVLNSDYHRVSDRTKLLGNEMDGVRAQIQSLPALQQQLHQQSQFLQQQTQIMQQMQQQIHTQGQQIQQMQEQIRQQDWQMQQQLRQIEQMQQQTHNYKNYQYMQQGHSQYQQQINHGSQQITTQMQPGNYSYPDQYQHQGFGNNQASYLQHTNTFPGQSQSQQPGVAYPSQGQVSYYHQQSSIAANPNGMFPPPKPTFVPVNVITPSPYNEHNHKR